MKKKTPYILLIPAIVVLAAIIITGINKKREEKAENIEYAEKAVFGENLAESGDVIKYEYYQTDPDSGLAVIYTFTVYPKKNGVCSGNITIQGAGNDLSLRCAVKIENQVTSFLFAGYENGDDGEFKVGDELVKLHKAEKDLFAEFLNLKKIFPGEDIARNY